MRLDEALFNEPYSAYLIKTHGDDSDFGRWQLEPLIGPTLSAAYVPNSTLQGEYVVASKIIAADGSRENCYMTIVLPERILEYHFRLQGGRVARGRGRQADSGTLIPSIAIEAIGTYTLYLVKKRIEEGIEVLRAGLAQARDQGPVALDLAYLLRDAGRNQEAIDSFTIAISLLDVNGSTRALYYRERAALHGKLGNKREAASDLLRAASLQHKSIEPR